MKKNNIPEHLKEWMKAIDPGVKKALIKKLEKLPYLTDDELKILKEDKNQTILIGGMALWLLKDRKEGLKRIDHITTIFKRELGITK